MTPASIAVSGAAGKTGLAVLRTLSTSGLPVRALIHHEDQRAAVTQAGAAEAQVADLLERSSLATALQGIKQVYFICPNVQPNELQMAQNMITAAKAAGLRRIVYHSVLLPAVKDMPHHWQKHLVELELAASGLDFVILQPASYMQNILPYWQSIRDAGLYRIPYSAEAPFTPIDLQDLATAACFALTQDALTGQTIPLAGPQQLTSQDMAAAASKSLGRKVRVEVQPLAAWKQQAEQSGMSAYAINALSAMFAYYDAHGLCGDPAPLHSLLGRPATSFAQFLDRL